MFYFLQSLDVDLKIETMCEKQTDGSWLCTECGYLSKWKTNMKMHIESRHLITAGVTCEICLQFCSNRKALREGFILIKGRIFDQFKQKYVMLLFLKFYLLLRNV